jgi:hypothetical protein
VIIPLLCALLVSCGRGEQVSTEVCWKEGEEYVCTSDRRNRELENDWETIRDDGYGERSYDFPEGADQQEHIPKRHYGRGDLLQFSDLYSTEP